MEITPEIEAALEQLEQTPNLYGLLAASIAPEISGHKDVKKVLLLLLTGGLAKGMGNGIKIRGDINVCLMGDPGVVKSQLLKYIFKVAPRGVYTTGESISGVGLISSVVRDSVTDKTVPEGGAVVSVNNGICCIDEFNEMKEPDRAVIHRVMKQQTISISDVTLDVRTSILAIANPLYGRYNPSLSPAENTNLPAALLSHFDINFLIVEEPTRDDDELEHYLAKARQYRPIILPSVSEYITQTYGQRKGKYKEQEEASGALSFASARTLSTMIRLSQALARLRVAGTVHTADVDEAVRLMKASKESFELRVGDSMGGGETSTSRAFRPVKGMPTRPSRGTIGRGPGGGMDTVMEMDEDHGGEMM